MKEEIAEEQSCQNLCLSLRTLLSKHITIQIESKSRGICLNSAKENNKRKLIKSNQFQR